VKAVAIGGKSRGFRTGSEEKPGKSEEEMIYIL
jgi:hypothetical protein